MRKDIFDIVKYYESDPKISRRKIRPTPMIFTFHFRDS